MDGRGGFKFVMNRDDDYTKSVVRSFDTVTTVTTTKINSYGGGGMMWLRYDVEPEGIDRNRNKLLLYFRTREFINIYHPAAVCTRREGTTCNGELQH